MDNAQSRNGSTRIGTACARHHMVAVLCSGHFSSNSQTNRTPATLHLRYRTGELLGGPSHRAMEKLNAIC
jgi:hypothetical protein